ncbi:MAG: ribosome maturation factor RimM [Candidatus Hydrogenedentota bacterium]
MDYFIIGRVGRSFGLNGEFRVHLFTDFFELFENIEFVYLSPQTENIKPMRYLILARRWLSGKLLLKLQNIETKEKVKDIVNQFIYLPEEELKVLPENKRYLVKLKGMKVVDIKSGVIGVIDDYYNFSGNTCIEINRGTRKSIFPYNKEFIVGLDKQKRILKTDYPLELIEQL